jgi:hypothetical protein
LDVGCRGLRCCRCRDRCSCYEPRTRTLPSLSDVRVYVRMSI